MKKPQYQFIYVQIVSMLKYRLTIILASGYPFYLSDYKVPKSPLIRMQKFIAILIHHIYML